MTDQHDAAPSGVSASGDDGPGTPGEQPSGRADIPREVLAERERCAKICEMLAVGYGGLAEGPLSTEIGKLVHESMSAGALNCAASIRGAGT